MRGFLVFFLLVFLFACVNKNNPPSGVLGLDSMRNVMWDMLLADQYSKQYLAKDSTKNLHQETMKLYQEVFKIHHITKEEYEKSYQYYTSRPDLVKLFFDSLSTYANRQRVDLYRPKPNLRPIKK